MIARNEKMEYSRRENKSYEIESIEPFLDLETIGTQLRFIWWIQVEEDQHFN